MNRKRSIALAIAFAATLASPGLAPVLATYPGDAVGRIAFAELRDGNFHASRSCGEVPSRRDG
jgi:hypothetical protein